jgi:hypothetical protein
LHLLIDNVSNFCVSLHDHIKILLSSRWLWQNHGA